MAISLVQTKKPHFLVPLLAFITMFLALLNRVNAANSLSFTFNNFSPDEKDLNLQGSAVINNNVLQLTKYESGGVGRALFYAPVRLWKKSAVEASFETTFKFEISAPTGINPGDGLAFFIASHDTQFPPNSAGKFLGLFPSDTALKNSSFSNKENDDFNNIIVAVEIDTYPNKGIDPNYKHIGIDVNSIVSNKTEKWEWQNGKVATARITYNSASQRLAAVVTYPSPVSSSVTLVYDIVLNTFFPEWVRVGFSASTGENRQTTTILSWSFTSNLVVTSEKENMYIASVV